MKPARARDVIAYSTFVLILAILGFSQFAKDDKQWNAATEILAPLYFLTVLFLCGAFYLRSTSFKIKSEIGPVFLDLDTTEGKIVSYRIRMIGSWIMLLIALFLLYEGSNHFGATFYKSDCDYNEECVAAYVMEESYLFSFLAPSTTEFEPGDIDNYNEIEMIFAPFVLILYGWFTFAFSSLLFTSIKRVIDNDKSNLADSKSEWREHYEKKSYRSFGAFLLSFASLYPTIFIVSNPQSSITIVGLSILLSSIGILYLMGLYFYTYYDRNLDHLDDDLFDAPFIGMLIVISIGFVYGIFSSPLDNASDIWLYDWIVKTDEFTIFSESTSFRYMILDIVGTGLAFALIASIIIWFMEEIHTEDGWKLIPGAIFVIAAGFVLLAIYGFVAMIVVEIISFNLVWVSPLVFSLFGLITAGLMFENIELSSMSLTNYTIDMEERRRNRDNLLRGKVEAESYFQDLLNQGYSNSVALAYTQQYHGYENTGRISDLLDGNLSYDEISSDPVLASLANRIYGSLNLPPQPTPPHLMHPIVTGQIENSPTMPLGSLESQASNQVEVSKPNLSTELLSSSNTPEVSRIVTVDSKGIKTIETGFSKVTLNKLTDEVTKIPQGLEQHSMFIQEIQNMVNLEAKGYDVGLIDYDDGASPKIVTRYRGPSKLSEHYKTLSVRGKKSMIEELVEHIAQIHECGMVHRDLKPDNILVDARPRDGNHQFDAIIDYGIAMKINRRQTESYNTAGTKFFGHSSQKDPDFKASTGQDWFALARIFALLLRGVDIDSLDAEIQMSQKGLEMSSTISTLGFDESIVQSISELIVLATDPNCEDNANIGKLAKVGKALSKKF